MKTCAYCLAEVPDAALKCQHCGEWLDRPPLAYETPSTPGDARRRPIVLIAIGLGIASFLLMISVIIVARLTVSPSPVVPARAAVTVSPPAAPWRVAAPSSAP